MTERDEHADDEDELVRLGRRRPCASAPESTRDARTARLARLTRRRDRCVRLLTLGVGLAEALGHAGEQLWAKPGLVDEAGELALAEHDELHVGVGDDGRVARRLVEEGELAEGLARAEGRDLPALAVTRAVPSRITKNSWPVSPSVTSDLARRRPHVLGPPGHQLQLLPGAGREQRDLLEVVDERVAAAMGGNLTTRRPSVHLRPCAARIARTWNLRVHSSRILTSTTSS